MLKKWLTVMFSLALAVPNVLRAQWQQLPGPGDSLANTNVYDLVEFKGSIFTSTDDGIYRSTDHGNDWNLVAAPFYDSKFSILDSTLYAFGYFGLRRWDDSGWVDLIDTSIASIAKQKNHIFAAIADNYYDPVPFGFNAILMSADNGKTWDTSYLPQTGDISSDFHVVGLYEESNRLFAFVTGTHWIFIDTGFGHSEDPEDAVDEFVSTDAGVTWTPTLMYNPSYLGPVLFDRGSSTSLFEGTPNGLWLWTGADSSRTSLHINGINRVTFMSSFDSGVMVGVADSSSEPANLSFVSSTGILQPVLSSDTLTSLTSFTFDSMYAYVGTQARGIFHAPLSGVPLAVERSHELTLLSLSVYPNPDPSQSSISFSLTQGTQVSLKLFDDLGVVRDAILEGELDAGQHIIPFADLRLPNGIYEVVLSTPTARSVGRLVIER
jgi:hypothetical protein